MDTTNPTPIIFSGTPTPDICIALFLLKTYGEKAYAGIVDAPLFPASSDYSGSSLVSIGSQGTDFNYTMGFATLTEAVATRLQLTQDPALKRLIEYAKRDQVDDRGTLSSDPIDRAFGLSMLFDNLCAQFPDHPGYVIELTHALIGAHHNEQMYVHHYLPAEFAERKINGTAHIFYANQEGRNLKCVYLETPTTRFLGYLRSQQGGAFDVVAVRTPDNHIYIVTRAAKRVDLRCLVALVRIKEIMLQGLPTEQPLIQYAAENTLTQIPQWHYNQSANTLTNEKTAPPTRITTEDMLNIIDVGLSKASWHKISGEVVETTPPTATPSEHLDPAAVG